MVSQKSIDDLESDDGLAAEVENRKPRPSISLLRIALFMILCAAGYFLVGRLDWSEIAASLRSVEPIQVAWGVGGVLGFWFARGWLLAVLIRRRVDLSIKAAFQVTAIGAFTDQVIPWKGGYVVRWLFLNRRFPGFRGFMASCLASSFLIEGVGLVIIAFLVLSIDPAGFEATRSLVIGLFIFFLISLSLAIVFAPQIARWRGQVAFLKKIPLLESSCELLQAARSPKVLIGWLLLPTLAWVFQILSAQAIALSFGKSLSVSQSIIVLLSLNLAILIPVLPANLGAMQVAITYVLLSMHWQESGAFSYSILFHAVQVIPLVIIGGICTFFTAARKTS